jgi:hypothetical protein
MPVIKARFVIEGAVYPGGGRKWTRSGLSGRVHQVHQVLGNYFRYAGSDFAGVFFGVGRGFSAGVLEVLAGGVEVFVDLDVLELRFQVVDHVLGDAETA